MIKFFRKVRQRLLSENKFSKYLIYAIGEIVLVVIGILIALQINNWSENEKTEKEIDSIISLLEDELTTNINSATTFIRGGDRVDSLLTLYKNNQFTKEFLSKNPNILFTLFQTKKADFRYENLDNLMALEKQIPEKYKSLIPHLRYLKRSVEFQLFWENKSIDLFHERYKELIDQEDWLYNTTDTSDELYALFNDKLFKNKINHYLEIQYENLKNISLIRNASIGILWSIKKEKSKAYPDIVKFLKGLYLKPLNAYDCTDTTYKVFDAGFARTFLIYNNTDESMGINIINEDGIESKPFYFSKLPSKMLYFGSYHLPDNKFIQIVKNDECYKVYGQFTEDYIIVE